MFNVQEDVLGYHLICGGIFILFNLWFYTSLYFVVSIAVQIPNHRKPYAKDNYRTYLWAIALGSALGCRGPRRWTNKTTVYFNRIHIQ